VLPQNGSGEAAKLSGQAAGFESFSEAGDAKAVKAQVGAQVELLLAQFYL